MIALALPTFFCLGILLVLPGALQFELARALSLNLEQSALLASAIAAGMGAGLVGAGPLVDRYPRRPVFVCAALVAGAGLLLVRAEGGFAGALVGMAAAGVGVGSCETVLNASVAQRAGPAAPRRLAFVHASATAGAVTGPLLLQLAAAQLSWLACLRGLGIVFLAIALLGMATALPAPLAKRTHGDDARLWLALLPFALMTACYVGFETAVTVMAVPWAEQGLGIGVERGGLAISAFWLGLLVGRLAYSRFGGSPATWLAAGGVASGALLAAGAGLGASALEPLVFTVGICLGLAFPVLMALTHARFPDSPGSAIGLVAGVGAVGGFLVPWGTGRLADGAGVLPAIASLSLWCWALAALALTVRRPRR